MKNYPDFFSFLNMANATLTAITKAISTSHDIAKHKMPTMCFAESACESIQHIAQVHMIYCSFGLNPLGQTGSLPRTILQYIYVVLALFTQFDIGRTMQSSSA